MNRFIALTIALLSCAGALAEEPTVDPAVEAEFPMEELRRFTAIYEQIRVNYVSELDDKTMLENAIKGLLSNLDPHSSYLDADDFVDLRNSSEGGYGGIGVEIVGEGSGVRVITPIDETPAAAAGIQAGDLIVQIDDETVRELGVEEAIDALSGEPGSTVTLQIIREGSEGLIEVAIERARINVPSVRHQVFRDNIGYIRVSQFQEDSGAEVKAAITALIELSVDGIILDLRNNPGGVVNAARDMADLFLPPSLIVYTEGQMAANQLRLSGTTPDFIDGRPIIVLINEGSASASEIVAGALQDYNRALLVGTRSFGKGSMQTVVPISETTAVKLTTALFFTPNGRSIQAYGILPDVVVERARVEAVQPRNLWPSEADLSGHLANGEGQEDYGERERLNDSTTEAATSLFKRDNQLFSALNIMQGMIANSAVNSTPE
ncbi:S41 family peptidase [Umboniibacter marinipuniceus]|uniref:Carboxyl-terminal processing protease n=1 Tax=Umboniibacter marinipuniceus TaxID=569599 RepID=A0A3M0A5E5_9GAMM|nr:S41 family peptidase [Umboniibacter marinipuniceus]RMA80263.1 carboxyl-terminal processing protease [Umboniibacter marinipuniceus]